MHAIDPSTKEKKPITLKEMLALFEEMATYVAFAGNKMAEVAERAEALTDAKVIIAAWKGEVFVVIGIPKSGTTVFENALVACGASLQREGLYAFENGEVDPFPLRATLIEKQ